jgi:hypothetical protein
MDPLLETILIGLGTGLVSGLIAGLISGLWVARILERREQWRQVRLVSGSITPTYEPVPGQPNARVMTGGHLTIKNSSDWPAWDVIVLQPHWLNALSVPYLGPGREHVETIALEVMMANRAIDPPVTLQVTTVRQRVYQWRPATDELFDTRWLPLQSRPVQWFARHLSLSWQHRFNALLMKLPEGAVIWVWGYHPATGERRSNNPKGQPLV